MGRIEEILVEPERERLVGLLVSKCQIKEDVPPYHFPACFVQEECELLAFEVSETKMNSLDNALTVNR